MRNLLKRALLNYTAWRVNATAIPEQQAIILSILQENDTIQAYVDGMMSPLDKKMITSYLKGDTIFQIALDLKETGQHIRQIIEFQFIDTMYFILKQRINSCPFCEAQRLNLNPKASMKPYSLTGNHCVYCENYITGIQE